MQPQTCAASDLRSAGARCAAGKPQRRLLTDLELGKRRPGVA